MSFPLKSLEAILCAEANGIHSLVFFRQIAATIYRKHKRWSQSIALSKQDGLSKDAIETAAVSGRQDVVDELLRYVSIPSSGLIQGEGTLLNTV